MLENNIKNDFWDHIENSYPKYPTVRHRKRFVVNAIKRSGREMKNIFLFDFGCGNGDILSEIKRVFSLNSNQIGGNDTSIKSIKESRKKTNSLFLYNDSFPLLNKKCDMVVCSEVIEHTPQYHKILKWVSDNLNQGGIFILTTQAGKMHKIDEYSGHTQTFDIAELAEILKSLNFNVKYSRLWGFPLFTLQKYLTDFNFNRIKDKYLEGQQSRATKLFLQFVYFVYFLHYIFNRGPQIFIVAEKNS